MGKLNEQIRRINEMMGNDDTQMNDYVKMDEFVNEQGEVLTLIELNDGEVLLKHSDGEHVKSEFLPDVTNFTPLDKLTYPYEGMRDKLMFYLRNTEKEFLSNFLINTKYEYLIPNLKPKKHITKD